MAPDWDEENLIRQILSGEKNQVNTAVSEMSGLARNMVIKIIRIGGGTDADAQMILHDALLELIKKIQNDSFDPNVAQLSTLLYAIARNKWLDELKRRHRINNHETSLQGNDPTFSNLRQNSFEAHLFTQEERKRIVWALRQLDTECRELFEMKYLEGITLRAIAEQLGISEDAVKKRHERCKKKLRTIFGQDPRLE